MKHHQCVLRILGWIIYPSFSTLIIFASPPPQPHHTLHLFRGQSFILSRNIPNARRFQNMTSKTSSENPSPKLSNIDVDTTELYDIFCFTKHLWHSTYQIFTKFIDGCTIPQSHVSTLESPRLYSFGGYVIYTKRFIKLYVHIQKVIMRGPIFNNFQKTEKKHEKF